eukprot:3355785-Rhodomonas_salina.2
MQVEGAYHAWSTGLLDITSDFETLSVGSAFFGCGVCFLLPNTGQLQNPPRITGTPKDGRPPFWFYLQGEYAFVSLISACMLCSVDKSE